MDVVGDDKVGGGFLRVGVDGRDTVRGADEFMVAGICDLAELGVEGLEVWDGLAVLSTDVVGGPGRVLDGVEDREETERLDGVDGLVIDEERVGVDGLV